MHESGCFFSSPEGKWSVGKPRKRWLDDVENNLKKWVLEMGEKQLGIERTGD
jgi:hypothetical protein